MTEIEEMWAEVQPEDFLIDCEDEKLAIYADEHGYVTILSRWSGEDAAICLHAPRGQDFLLAFAAALFKAQAIRNKHLEVERAEKQDLECKVNRCAHCFRSPPKVIR